MNELAAVCVAISGRVQGVNFRAYTHRHAERLGLVGYVRNLPDRSVEVYAEGSKEKLESLLESLRKGPPASRIVSMTTDWLEYTGKYENFGITF
jgi:acylphosphatase